MVFLSRPATHPLNCLLSQNVCAMFQWWRTSRELHGVSSAGTKQAIVSYSVERRKEQQKKGNAMHWLKKKKVEHVTRLWVLRFGGGDRQNALCRHLPDICWESLLLCKRLSITAQLLPFLSLQWLWLKDKRERKGWLPFRLVCGPLPPGTLFGGGKAAQKTD